MIRTNCRSTALFLAALVLGGRSAAQAGPDAVPPPLPDGFFNGQTVIFGRVDLTAARIDRLFAALGTIVPSVPVDEKSPSLAKGFAVLRQLADNPAQVEQLRKNRPDHPLSLAETSAARLVEAGFRHVYVVVQTRGAEPGPMKVYFLLPRKAKESNGVPPQLTDVGAKLKLSVQSVGNWYVGSQEQALPQPAEDFGLEDAAFTDAMLTNPDHDVMFTFVPTPEMRVAARAQTESLRKGLAPGEQQFSDFLHRVQEVVAGDWFYGSIQLGDEPAIRLSAHFGDAAAPQSLADGLQQLVAAGQSQGAADDAAKLGLEVMRLLLPSPQQSYLTWNLDQQRLSSLLKAIVSLAPPAN
jgi:hypothetical protein